MAFRAVLRRTTVRRVAACLVAIGAAVALIRLANGVFGAEDHGRTCTGRAGLDLSRRTVPGSDLSQRPLRCVNLQRAWLEHVDLSGADLSDAVAGSAELTGVKLTHADLRRIRLDGATLTDVGLQDARLKGASLRGVSLSRSDLAGADARRADLTGASLVDTNLRGARLDGAALTRTTWSNVVCPDGVKSAGTERESCDGHLRRAS